MTENVQLAIVAVCAGVVGPVTLALITSHIARTTKQQDYAREDAIAERQDEKLEQIHTLVNSNMTVAIENELVALKSLYALMTRDSYPNGETVSARESTRLRIVELERQLKDRAAQLKESDADMAEGGTAC